jgi:hypothetical protein
LAKWLDAAGVGGAQLSHGPVLNRVSMAIDAAADGQGGTLRAPHWRQLI